VAALLVGHQWRPQRRQQAQAGRQAAGLSAHDAWASQLQICSMQSASSERSSLRMAIFSERANRSIRAGW
jgi:hypothetical protein